jgi:Lrp/AsnC family transcriptional regulator, leucine-responsive regulatory protein
LIDHIDMAIIQLLKRNARLQWKQIGEQVHMSAPAVANRIQRLEDCGIIEGYTVKLNERLIGNSTCVFITVVMRNYNHDKFQSFLLTCEDVQEAHRISGEPCFLLKAVVPDEDRLAKLLDGIHLFGHYKVNISIGQCV